jgi:uncharacterized membrane protein
MISYTSFLVYLLLVVTYVSWDALMFGVAFKSLYSAFYNGITDHFAAAAIYLLYPAAIMVLTLSPSAQETALKGIVLGLTGYGLYHFTNMATLTRWPVDTGADMKSWPWKITTVDILLGATITTILSLVNRKLTSF